MRSIKFKATKEFTFEASHVLEGLPHNHPCSRVHGHSYKAWVSLEATNLDEVGMTIDFNVIKTIGAKLDHRHLNDVMGGLNPTAENLCKFIYEAMNQIILALDAHDDVIVTRVRVQETEKSIAELEVVG